MIDDIYEYMDNTKEIKAQEMNKIKKYISSEKFDTDSLFYDVSNDKESNILLQTTSKIFRNHLHHYIQFKQGISPNVCHGSYDLL